MRRFRGYFHKADYLCMLSMLLIVLFFFVFRLFAAASPGERVQITVNGRLYGEYPAGETRTVRIRDAKGKVMNTVEIEGEGIRMKDADCPDRLCVRMGTIRSSGSSIVCLPNQVVVTLTGDKGKTGDSIDSMAQ